MAGIIADSPRYLIAFTLAQSHQKGGGSWRRKRELWIKIAKSTPVEQFGLPYAEQ